MPEVLISSSLPGFVPDKLEDAMMAMVDDRASDSAAEDVSTPVDAVDVGGANTDDSEVVVASWV